MKADKGKIKTKVFDERQTSRIKMMRALRFGFYLAAESWLLYRIHRAHHPLVVPANGFFDEEEEEIVLLPANPQGDD